MNSPLSSAEIDALVFDLYGLTAAERRLNVAVTRAREQMGVFSSMRYSDIHDDGELPRGVAGLRGKVARPILMLNPQYDILRISWLKRLTEKRRVPRLIQAQRKVKKS